MLTVKLRQNLRNLQRKQQKNNHLSIIQEENKMAITAAQVKRIKRNDRRRHDGL